MEAIIFNQSCWIYENDISSLKKSIENILQQSNFTVIGSVEHFFSPFGYTKLWLLAESHLAIHTFPETQAIYIELSSCIKIKFDLFWNNIFELATLNNFNLKIMSMNINQV